MFSALISVAMASTHQHRFKLLLIGDSGSGKAQLVVKFAEDGSLEEPFVSTIGVDFKVRELEVNGKKVRLQIWNTAGSEKFKSIITSYYRGTKGIFLVYDVTSEKSFDNTKPWMQNITKNAAKNVVIILLANKSHLKNDDRQVSWERGRSLAQEFGIKFFEVSTDTCNNIQEALKTIAKDILAKESSIVSAPVEYSAKSDKSHCSLQ